MGQFGYNARWMGIVMAVGLASFAGWSQFLHLTAALSYAAPLHLMCIGVCATSFSYALNHSKAIEQSIPAVLRQSAAVLSGAVGTMMGWACLASAFPMRELPEDTAIRVILAVVAASVGFYASGQLRFAIRNSFGGQTSR